MSGQARGLPWVTRSALPALDHAGCSDPNPNTKWSAGNGISARAPILGYNPPSYAACCARCGDTSGCALFTFLARPASVGNLCYLYTAGATTIATLPSSFSTFYSGEGEFTARSSVA